MSMRFVNLALVLFIPTFCSPHTLCCKCAASGQVMNNFYSSFTNTSRSFNSMNDETASRNNFYNFTARSALMEAFVAPRCMDAIVCGEFCCEFPMKRHKREMTSNNRHSHNWVALCKQRATILVSISRLCNSATTREWNCDDDDETCFDCFCSAIKMIEDASSPA